MTIASDLLHQHIQTLVADNAHWQTLLADDVVWAGDDAAGATGAQARGDDLLVELLPLRGPTRSGLRHRHARNLASVRGSPPRQFLRHNDRDAPDLRR